jgi:hypothetical protein
MRLARLAAVLLLATLLLPAHYSVAAQTRAADPRELALVGGTIYTSPGADPITNGVVLITDGRIAAVGPRTAIKVPPGGGNCRLFRPHDHGRLVEQSRSLHGAKVGECLGDST